jgi:hypothetical protein
MKLSTPVPPKTGRPLTEGQRALIVLLAELCVQELLAEEDVQRNTEERDAS